MTEAEESEAVPKNRWRTPLIDSLRRKSAGGALVLWKGLLRSAARQAGIVKHVETGGKWVPTPGEAGAGAEMSVDSAVKVAARLSSADAAVGSAESKMDAGDFAGARSDIRAAVDRLRDAAAAASGSNAAVLEAAATALADSERKWEGNRFVLGVAQRAVRRASFVALEAERVILRARAEARFGSKKVAEIRGSFGNRADEVLRAIMKTPIKEVGGRVAASPEEMRAMRAVSARTTPEDRRIAAREGDRYGEELARLGQEAQVQHVARAIAAANAIDDPGKLLVRAAAYEGPELHTAAAVFRNRAALLHAEAKRSS